MSKLLKLKEWLTVDDAARRLSITAGESVTEADILRLALDGHLTLSVYFVNHAYARAGEIVPREQAKTFTSDLGTMGLPEEPYTVLIGMPIDENHVLELEQDQKLWPVSLQGVWDLPMLGAEALDVEHEFQNLTGGPEVTLHCLEGVFVRNGEGKIFQLQASFEDNEFQRGSRAQLVGLKQKIAEGIIESAEAEKILKEHAQQREKLLERVKSQPRAYNYYPAGVLPSDSVLVVRTNALRDLETKLLSDDQQEEKPLHNSERRSMTQIIAVLASIAKLDLSSPYAANETLRLEADTKGLEFPKSADTVAKHLKAAAGLKGKTP